jgi:hypothetical protein
MHLWPGYGPPTSGCSIRLNPLSNSGTRLSGPSVRVHLSVSRTPTTVHGPSRMQATETTTETADGLAVPAVRAFRW